MTEEKTALRKDRLAQDAWAFLRRTKTPKTTREIIDGSGASQQSLNRWLNAWAEAGFVERGERGPGGYLWTFIQGGRIAPVLRKTGELLDFNETMKATELARLRRKAGMSLADVAEAIGWSRKSARNVHRLEIGETAIRPDIAEKIRKALND